jgi:hypothetical protein
MPSRAVLFDLDGTLADTAPTSRRRSTACASTRASKPLPHRAAAPVRLGGCARAGARGLRREARRRGLRGAARSVPRGLPRAHLRGDEALPRHRGAARGARAARSPGASSPTRRRASPTASWPRSGFAGLRGVRRHHRAPEAPPGADAARRSSSSSSRRALRLPRRRPARHPGRARRGHARIAVDWGYHHPEQRGPGAGRPMPCSRIRGLDRAALDPI